MGTIPLAPWSQWTGRPSLVATFWALHRESNTALCVLYTHVNGWEVCLQGEHRFARTRVCKIAKMVIQTRDEWKVRLLREGWRAHAQPPHLERRASPRADLK
jgi:hypothetical protein